MNWIGSTPTTGPAATVKIEFSSTGNSGPWSVVAVAAPNSGTYQWSVPAVNSPNCFLKFTITQGTSAQTVTTSNAFGIGTCTNPPTSADETETDAFGFSVYPNPMSSQGYAHFLLEENAPVKIQIVDLLGNEAAVIMNGNYTAGSYNPAIPVEKLNAGIYFCRMVSGDREINQKIVVAK